MFPVQSHDDSRRSYVYNVYHSKYSPAQVEGMKKAENPPLHRLAELALAPSGSVTSIADIFSKSITTKSRKKNFVPCEP